MKTQDLLIQNERNHENYENIISVLEESAGYFGVTIEVTGTSWRVIDNDYDGALMDIECRSIEQLRMEYSEVF